MNPNIPETNRKRVVIVGAGFGGLKLARKLSKMPEFQVVLVNRNNFHEFQPLYYQVATAGLEPNSILFPLRAVFKSEKEVIIRITNVTGVRPADNEIDTELGPIRYDFLVIATGADTNFFNQQNIIDKGLPMKSISEAIALRNRLLQNFEDALSVETRDDMEGFMDVVVVGGGPTGVELCGTLAEMRRTVLPSDYPELDFQAMDIYLIESGAELLGPMSVESQQHSLKYLQDLGVHVRLNTRVSDFDGRTVTMNDGSTLRANNLIWAAGVRAQPLAGLPAEVLGKGNRILVDRINRMQGSDNIFAVGDVALMTDEKWPNGHPQVAQPAIQQGRQLGLNLQKLVKGQPTEPFTYHDYGTMATIGRGLAVVDLPFLKFQGVLAWLTWLFVHLMAIVGVKNRLFIFMNWMVNYLTYNNSLRLIIRPRIPHGDAQAMRRKIADQVDVKPEPSVK